VTLYPIRYLPETLADGFPTSELLAALNSDAGTTAAMSATN
jgi:hypothetical protein